MAAAEEAGEEEEKAEEESKHAVLIQDLAMRNAAVLDSDSL